MDVPAAFGKVVVAALGTSSLAASFPVRVGGIQKPRVANEATITREKANCIVEYLRLKQFRRDCVGDTRRATS